MRNFYSSKVTLALCEKRGIISGNLEEGAEMRKNPGKSKRVGNSVDAS